MGIFEKNAFERITALDQRRYRNENYESEIKSKKKFDLRSQRTDQNCVSSELIRSEMRKCAETWAKNKDILIGDLTFFSFCFFFPPLIKKV